MNTVKWMNEWVSEFWHTQIPMKVRSVQWTSSFWGGGISTGPQSLEPHVGGVCSVPRVSKEQGGRVKLCPNLWGSDPGDGPGWMGRIEGVMGMAGIWSLEKQDRATSQGRPKAKPSPIIICRVCCPRFVEDLPGLISSREIVMCVSNYSFKSKHYLYQRALRRLLRGL